MAVVKGRWRRVVYALDELGRIIAPIARRYGIQAVYVFGSYARGQATEDSDVDVLIEREGSMIATLFDLGALYSDLSESLGKPLDLITEESLRQDDVKRRTPQFLESLLRERIAVYEEC
jgi:predicted nucleotidyltransferase